MKQVRINASVFASFMLGALLQPGMVGGLNMISQRALAALCCLTLSACGSNNGKTATASSTTPFSSFGSDSSNGAASSFGTPTSPGGNPVTAISDASKTLENAKGTIAGSDTQKSQAIDQGLGNLSDLSSAMGSLSSVQTNAQAQAAQQAIVAAEHHACDAAVALDRAGLPQLGNFFHYLCRTKTIYEVIHDPSFPRHMFTDDASEALYMVQRWAYSRVGFAFRVFAAANPYANDPTEAPSGALVPLYRCWIANGNFFMTSTTQNCDGYVTTLSPADPSHPPRLLGYLASQQATSSLPVVALFHAGIPDHAVTVNPQEAQALGAQGFQLYKNPGGILGFAPMY